MAATWMSGEQTAWLFGGVGRQPEAYGGRPVTAGPLASGASRPGRCDAIGAEAGPVTMLCDLMAYSVAAQRWELIGDCETGQNFGDSNLGRFDGWPTAAVEAATWVGDAGDTLWLFGGADATGLPVRAQDHETTTVILLRPPLPFSRCVNGDGERASAKLQSRQWLGRLQQRPVAWNGL